MITLEDIYKKSSSISNNTLPTDIIERLKKIGEHCYKQKGVYTVTMTLLLYKINHPDQDIRYHQSNMKDGFSGRSFDSKYVTPELARLGLPAMAESGWLTRSLEQPYPYDLSYNGKISGGLKDDFLLLLDFVQKEPKEAETMLCVLMNTVVSIVKNNEVHIEPLSNPEKLTITKIIQALDSHFNYNYGTHNGAKLPVLAFYAVYLSIIKEIQRYNGCTLAPLANLTACDLTSKASGDIEIFKNDSIYEAIEIKLNKQIDAQIVRVAKDKIYKFNPERYYILSSIGTKEQESEEIQNIVTDVKKKHGCQIIINGLLPTIKYYLRLISSLQIFVSNYSNLVQNDTELQRTHKERWNNIMKEQLNTLD